MNKIELLEQSKEEISAFTSSSNVFDKAYQKLEMLIRKFFGEQSHYLKKIQSIHFHSPIYFDGMSEDNSWFLSGKESLITLIDTMIEDLQLDVPKPLVQTINQNKSAKVFVVHGRDDLAKIEVARFLEKLGIEAIILHEQVNGGATIIEKFEQYSDVGFAVILYTPCDTGKYKDDKKANFRARQNVVFEHGYFIGKIGRKNVLALVKDNVEKPSDIDGVVYQPMDNSGAWKFKLAKELQNCNFDIDMNKISI